MRWAVLLGGKGPVYMVNSIILTLKFDMIKASVTIKHTSSNRSHPSPSDIMLKSLPGNLDLPFLWSEMDFLWSASAKALWKEWIQENFSSPTSPKYIWSTLVMLGSPSWVIVRHSREQEDRRWNHPCWCGRWRLRRFIHGKEFKWQDEFKFRRQFWAVHFV